LPIPAVDELGPSASVALLAEGHGVPEFSGLDAALAEPQTGLRLFGKPRVAGKRRVGVALARGSDVESARERARQVAQALTIRLGDAP